MNVDELKIKQKKLLKIYFGGYSQIKDEILNK